MRISKSYIACSFWTLLRASTGRRTAKHSFTEKRPYLWTDPDYSVGVQAIDCPCALRDTRYGRCTPVQEQGFDSPQRLCMYFIFAAIRTSFAQVLFLVPLIGRQVLARG